MSPARTRNALPRMPARGRVAVRAERITQPQLRMAAGPWPMPSGAARRTG